MLSLVRRAQPVAPTRSCRQCGAIPAGAAALVCRRCGIPFGDAPRADAELPTCPICYRTVDDDGLLPSLTGQGRRPIAEHMGEHDRFPVGDDEWLDSLREGDRIRVGRWFAPFDLVRRYLVTGAIDGGRRRAIQHDAVVTAMSQLARWGGRSGEILGDQAEWREARAAVTALMERYHRR
jgi:hypothetical protein